MGAGVPEVVIVNVSSVPCGKVTLEGLVKLGAVSAKSTGIVVKVVRMTAAASNRGKTRTTDPNPRLGENRLDMVKSACLQPASCQMLRKNRHSRDSQRRTYMIRRSRLDEARRRSQPSDALCWASSALEPRRSVLLDAVLWDGSQSRRKVRDAGRRDECLATELRD